MATQNFKDLSDFWGSAVSRDAYLPHQHQTRTDSVTRSPLAPACVNFHWVSMRLIVHADWFCTLKLKRQPMKKKHNYFHQSRQPWGSWYEFQISLEQDVQVWRLCVRLFQGHQQILWKFFKCSAVLSWPRCFAYCGQVPDVPKRLYLQRIWRCTGSYLIPKKKKALLSPSRHTAATAHHSQGRLGWRIR